MTKTQPEMLGRSARGAAAGIGNKSLGYQPKIWCDERSLHGNENAVFDYLKVEF